ncbi:hypothetical protein BBC0178_016150 [Bartonella apihabitans]|uniref:Uncharacterized protein n=1 Tax=Bartonella apihabitans TaxID=2750929 RepID=A0A1U9MC21_9HYPH|nr:hypothetical protein BBC0178_016150 [Bartonella apihabitans]
MQMPLIRHENRYVGYDKNFEFSSWNDVSVQTGLYIGFSFKLLFHALIEI